MDLDRHRDEFGEQMRVQRWIWGTEIVLGSRRGAQGWI